MILSVKFLETLKITSNQYPCIIAFIDYFSVAYDGKVTASLDALSAIGIGDYELVVAVEDKAKIPLNDTSVVIIYVNMLGTTPVPPIVRAPMISKNCDDTVEIEEVNKK